MSRKSKQGPRKHVPQRTCVACRQVGPARQLMRIVRLPAGGVELDETHKKPGRGAYLCESRACWENALTRKLLEHALKTEITQEEREVLWQQCRTLPTESAEQSAALAHG